MTVNNHEFRERSETSPGIVYPSWRLNHRRHDQDVSVMSREVVAQHVWPLVAGPCELLGICLMHEGGVSYYEGLDSAFEPYPWGAQWPDRG